MKIAVAVSKISIVALLCMIAPHYAHASEANYGAGFWPSPHTTSQTNDSLSANQDNYGAGFKGSPTLNTGTISTGDISTNNYGQGFTPSPSLSGMQQTPTVTTGNYGAGFTGSPTPIHTFGYRTTSGNYGAGFERFGYPSSWFGAAYAPYGMYGAAGLYAGYLTYW